MSRPVEAWFAYYPDEVHASAVSEWGDLPDEGVQVIVLYFDEYTADGAVQYRKLLDGDDLYWHVPDTDEFGSTNDPTEIPNNALVKRGLEVEDGAFEDIKERAFSTWR